MSHTPEEIGAKMDALGLWELLFQFNWALRPQGTVLPYFCSILKGDRPPVKVRLLLLEGWQTMHDFVLVRADRNYGFVTSPIELPHFELLFLTDGGVKLFRHDVGYLPREADERERDFASRLLWESYGVMLRIESDNSLVFHYAQERSMFARVESKDGVWRDEPLAIPTPVPPVEKVAVPAEDLRKAQDLPFDADLTLDVDFSLVPNLATREKKPRTVYALVGADAKSHDRMIDLRVSIGRDGGLRQLWEQMPVQFVRALAAAGRIPGVVRVKSGRVFRLLRNLCIDLPFKLSLHDRLETFDGPVGTN